MDHPNIVKAHEMYTYKKQIFLVLELCDGGDLYTRRYVNIWYPLVMQCWCT
jgi:serine/threonine protein kinase